MSGRGWHLIVQITVTLVVVIQNCTTDRETDRMNSEYQLPDIAVAPRLYKAFFMHSTILRAHSF